MEEHIQEQQRKMYTRRVLQALAGKNLAQKGTILKYVQK
jgi:hypothetical protein